MNQLLNEIAMRRYETLNCFLRRVYEMFKMVHVNGLITSARNAIGPAARHLLTDVPGLDSSMNEHICTLNSDAETHAYPHPFNIIHLNENNRILHLLNGLQRDPDKRFEQTTTQYANSPDQSIRNLVNMLEIYSRTFDYKSKFDKREKALKAVNTNSSNNNNNNNNNHLKQASSNDTLRDSNSTTRHCDYCEEHRPDSNFNSHSGNYCYFDPNSKLYKGSSFSKSIDSKLKKTVLKSALKVVTDAMKDSKVKSRIITQMNNSNESVESN